MRRRGRIARALLAPTTLAACAGLVACGAILDLGDDEPPSTDAGGADAVGDGRIATDGGARDATDGAAPADAGADSDAAVTSKLVFVSSAVTLGDMKFGMLSNTGGRANADTTCRDEANVAGYPTSRIFVAWLSTSTEDAIARLPKQNVEWRLTEGGGIPGPVVFASHGDLAAGVPKVPINRNASGIVIPAPLEVYTGTRSIGTKIGGRCGDWSSASGMDYGMYGNLNVALSWSEVGEGSCDVDRRVYCFEQ